MNIPALEGTGLTAQVLKVLIALALAIPTGWERFKHDRSAGLRTFPLVSIASCAYLVIVGSSGSDAQARILVGVMTGIGFIGGGSIIHDTTSVHGTATAASLWNMGALGAAVAYGHYGLAVLLCVLNYVCLLLMRPVEDRIKKEEGNA